MEECSVKFVKRRDGNQKCIKSNGNARTWEKSIDDNVKVHRLRFPSSDNVGEQCSPAMFVLVGHSPLCRDRIITPFPWNLARETLFGKYPTFMNHSKLLKENGDDDLKKDPNGDYRAEKSVKE